MPWSTAVVEALEDCHGSRLGAVQWREHWSSSVEGVLEQCLGVRSGALQWMETLVQCFEVGTGEVHWIYDCGSVVEVHWDTNMQGILKRNGGRNGAMEWREDWSSAVMGTLEQFTGCMTG